VVKGNNFKVFDEAELVVGINASGCAGYTRKQLDELTDFVKRPQIGATGLVYVRVNTDGTIKSSVDKFYDEAALQQWVEAFDASPGDLLLVLAGKADKTRKALNELRLEMGTRLGLRDKNKFSCLWVIDFPLFEYNEEDASPFHFTQTRGYGPAASEPVGPGAGQCLRYGNKRCGSRRRFGAHLQ
jgi:aspartyl-tRNA synthetase